MRRASGSRRGFAVATALCMVAIAGVAMAAVCALLAADVRRTLSGDVDAQLRQLLIAGEIDAPAHLSDPTQQAWDTPLPMALGSAQVRTSRVADGDGARLRVSARLGDRSAREDLRFDRSGGGWRLVGAEMLALGDGR